MPEMSVIICTHNPRMDYLERVLEALRGQSFPLARWELLLIDNKSEHALAERMDLSWHPKARVVREEELGLTRARLRGIAEAKAELLVFVDDDNVLFSDYLEAAEKISVKHPNLGAWSGQVLPEFEVTPPPEIEPFLGVLCIRRLNNDFWGNHRETSDLPYGAGMVVRKSVARFYSETISTKPSRLGLDRRGDSLASSGDLDLGLSSVDLGMGTGLFESLKLNHLIPKKRLNRKYILKIIEDSTCGHAIFEKERGLLKAEKISGIDRLIISYKLFMATPMQKAVAAARASGLARAAQYR